MISLVIMGAPGSGKGTQASRIAGKLGVPVVSTGDIFRANISERTPLGIQARSYVDAGNYVPDSVTNGMVRARLSENDVQGGFLLDGYPRTSGQVACLDGILADQSRELDAVIELVVPTDELVNRLLGRGQESGRSDDEEQIIRHRLSVYQQQTGPVVQVYRERGLVHSIDGQGTMEEISDRVMAALGRSSEC